MSKPKKAFPLRHSAELAAEQKVIKYANRLVRLKEIKAPVIIIEKEERFLLDAIAEVSPSTLPHLLEQAAANRAKNDQLRIQRESESEEPEEVIIFTWDHRGEDS